MKGLSDRRRRRLEREVGSLRGRLSQLRAELEEASLRSDWLALDEDQASVAEGRAWGKQAAALRTAIAELEQRIFSREIELL